MDSFLQKMRINSFSLKVTIIHCLILWRKLSLSARYSPSTKFACCLYILTNASRLVNLSYYGGLRWRMGCEGRGRGEGCSWHRSVCVCVWACELGRGMRWENTLTNSIVSWRLYITVHPGWWVSKRGNAFNVQREDYWGTRNRICLFSGNGSIFISPSAEAQARVQWMVWIIRYHWIPE